MNEEWRFLVLFFLVGFLIFGFAIWFLHGAFLRLCLLISSSCNFCWKWKPLDKVYRKNVLGGYEFDLPCRQCVLDDYQVRWKEIGRLSAQAQDMWFECYKIAMQELLQKRFRDGYEKTPEQIEAVAVLDSESYETWKSFDEWKDKVELFEEAAELARAMMSVASDELMRVGRESQSEAKEVLLGNSDVSLPLGSMTKDAPRLSKFGVLWESPSEGQIVRWRYLR